MAHLKTDLTRLQRAVRTELERDLATVNMSAAFRVQAGTWQGDAHDIAVPECIRIVGGEYDPLSGEMLGPPSRPAVTMCVQEQQVAPLVSDAMFLAVFGGQRSGKTFVGRLLALRVLLTPRSVVYYLLPKFGKSGFVLDGLLDVLDAQGWIVARNANEHRYELINGSVLQVFSAADRRSEETFLGGECDLALLEEFREMPERVFEKLFSRIISRSGRMAIVTSPEAGHMIEEIDRGEWADRVEFEVHRLDVRNNFYIYDRPPSDSGEQAIIEVARRLYDERRFARDVEGKNVAESGNDFYNWDSRVHVVDSIPGVDVTRHLWASEDLWLSRSGKWRGPGSVRADKTLTDRCVLVGMDFGATIMSAVEARVTVPEDTTVDPAGVPLITWENATLVVVREHTRDDSNTVDFVDRTMIPAGLTPDRVVIFCDPAGNCRNAVNGENSVSYLRKRGYRVFWKHEDRISGIDAIRVRLHMRRLVVMRRCASLQKCMSRVRTIGRGPRDVSRDPFGHLPDALRYLVVNTFPFRDVIRKPHALEAVTHAFN